jgi:hypothetical protein
MALLLAVGLSAGIKLKSIAEGIETVYCIKVLSVPVSRMRTKTCYPQHHRSSCRVIQMVEAEKPLLILFGASAVVKFVAVRCFVQLECIIYCNRFMRSCQPFFLASFFAVPARHS